jgi:Ca-activated chloride channel family protein
VKNKALFIIFIFFNLVKSGQAQEVNEVINNANEFYKQQQYEQAGIEYRKVLETDPTNQIAQFNLGNTLYRMGKLPEAAQIFNDLSTKEKDKVMRTKEFYNNGVMMTKQQKLEESIEAYKNALRTDPSDTMARENLQKALLELKKKNPSKKNDEKQKKDEKKPQPPKSKMNQKEAEQKMKLLQQKEKEVQERLQKNSRSGSSQPKDW